MSAACCQLVVWIARHIRLCFCYGSSCIIYLHQSNSRLGLADNASAHRKISPAAHCSKQARFPLCLSTAECQFCSCDSLFRSATFDVVIVRRRKFIMSIRLNVRFVTQSNSHAQSHVYGHCEMFLAALALPYRFADCFYCSVMNSFATPFLRPLASSAPHPHNYGYCGTLNTAPAKRT